ncbi:hypothetical protein N0V84_008986 [Fusarium piperis]|uniref:Uncharacterized protein n=1 Tax=Fusarium piperis TaxID=1435070 RepID=A0A9W8W748_9HYPO|nr:hypothetical protein N0V84_008986 [Fusarium piperis]
MSDKSLSADAAIDMMDTISTKLREAIIKSMPCAFEQYLTISISAKPNKDTRYGQALDFLRSSVEVSQKKIPEQKVKGAKKKVVQMGGSESLVEVYVAKQLGWAAARAKLDEARNQAVDARMNRADQQGSAEYSERQKNIRNESTRDAMVLAIDGTEWASVTLEPKNW